MDSIAAGFFGLIEGLVRCLDDLLRSHVPPVSIRHADADRDRNRIGFRSDTQLGVIGLLAPSVATSQDETRFADRFSQPLEIGNGFVHFLTDENNRRKRLSGNGRPLPPQRRCVPLELRR